MKFVRFGLQDGNYFYESEKHQWSVPLSLGGHAVGLHSLHLVLNSANFKEDENLPMFLSVKTNLIEKSIINQTGILKLVPGTFKGDMDKFYYSFETVNRGLFI